MRYEPERQSAAYGAVNDMVEGGPDADDGIGTDQGADNECCAARVRHVTASRPRRMSRTWSAVRRRGKSLAGRQAHQPRVLLKS